MKKNKKTKSLSIKISGEDKEFLKDNKLRASDLFNSMLEIVKKLRKK
tara:strand:+ start:586 stop:726 length:141 start_codon:yes stop_codon:yes gene_type:complete